VVWWAAKGGAGSARRQTTSRRGGDDASNLLGGGNAVTAGPGTNADSGEGTWIACRRRRLVSSHYKGGGEVKTGMEGGCSRVVIFALMRARRLTRRSCNLLSSVFSYPN
jgi:hypothetical protein